MQQYMYPGQWFDDLGAVVAATTPGMAWDLGSSGLSREETNEILEAYEQTGFEPYPGE